MLASLSVSWYDTPHKQTINPALRIERWQGLDQSGVNAMTENDCTMRKRCTTCGLEFPATLEFFFHQNQGKYGLGSECKKCQYIRRMKYRKEHPEALEKARISNANWIAAHPEKVKEIRARTRLKNSDKRREYSKTRYATHRDLLRARGEEYRKTHLEGARIRSHRRRARERGLPDTFTIADWYCAMDYWRGLCAYCGNTPSLFDIRTVLHADHFVPLASSECPGTVKDNMVPACQNCNFKKGNKLPHLWVVERFGRRKAKEIESRIMVYFEWTKSQHE